MFILFVEDDKPSEEVFKCPNVLSLQLALNALVWKIPDDWSETILSPRWLIVTVIAKLYYYTKVIAKY